MVFCTIFVISRLCYVQAFLTRVASNPIGARDIVSLNALNYLAQCSFIEMRPSYHGDGYHMTDHVTSGFIPTSFDRYRQLFLPLLKFLIALLTCPGSHHKEACIQVASFIALHSEVFAAVLKEHLHASVDTMATLEELSLVTAVVSHSGVGEYNNIMQGVSRLKTIKLVEMLQSWTFYTFCW